MSSGNPLGASPPLPASSTVSNTANFFVERDDLLALIGSVDELEVTSGTPTPTDSPLGSPADSLLIEKVVEILDKYLECPTLLDPHLEDMMNELVTPSIALIHQLYGGSVDTNSSTNSSTSSPTNSLDLLKLDTYLTLIHALCKVRGYKTVKKLFTHDAVDLEPTLSALLSHSSPASPDTLDTATSKPWQALYSLLLWLSMLALVPFDICSIDSSDDTASQATSSLVSRIIEAAKER